MPTTQSTALRRPVPEAGKRPPLAARLPQQLTIPTCFGCGAMSRPGTCATGCAEHKLVVVRSATLGELREVEAKLAASIEALRMIAEALQDPPGAQDWGAAYGALQSQALAVLRTVPESAAVTTILREPTEAAVTWWCDRCHGVDAPQDCLGICLWRSVNWTRQDLYEVQRAHAIAEQVAERRLRNVARNVAHVSPRPGQHLRHWRAMAREAAGALAQASG